MKTIFNLFLICALAGFATRAQAQNTGDIRNSYNNDLSWTSEPDGVTPGPPAPPIVFSGIEDARDMQSDLQSDLQSDTQNYSDGGDQSMETMPEFHNLGGFDRGNASQPAASEGVSASMSGTPFAGGIQLVAAPVGGSHDGAPAGGGRRR